MNIVIIDNGNLFTYSIVDELEKRQCTAVVYRNDVDLRIVDNAVKKLKPKLIIIAPGSETQTGGISQDVVRNYYQSIPVLGIGYGFESIVAAFGGTVDRAVSVMHGKTCKVHHDGKSIFKKVTEPFTAGRYNSLAAIEVPYSFEVSARDEHSTVLAIRHKEAAVEAILFHPESILTPSGSELFDNLVKEVKK